MKRIAFKCILQTDVVITSNAATEGFYKSLDYIPGSKFLGIVAGEDERPIPQGRVRQHSKGVNGSSSLQ